MRGGGGGVFFWWERSLSVINGLMATGMWSRYTKRFAWGDPLKEMVFFTSPLHTLGWAWTCVNNSHRGYFVFSPSVHFISDGISHLVDLTLNGILIWRGVFYHFFVLLCRDVLLHWSINIDIISGLVKIGWWGNWMLVNYFTWSNEWMLNSYFNLRV